jgi:hypothetical protein
MGKQRTQFLNQEDPLECSLNLEQMATSQSREEILPRSNKVKDLHKKIFKGMNTKMVFFEKSLMETKRDKMSYSPKKKIDIMLEPQLKKEKSRIGSQRESPIMFKNQATTDNY